LVSKSLLLEHRPSAAALIQICSSAKMAESQDPVPYTGSGVPGTALGTTSALLKTPITWIRESLNMAWPRQSIAKSHAYLHEPKLTIASCMVVVAIRREEVYKMSCNRSNNNAVRCIAGPGEPQPTNFPVIGRLRELQGSVSKGYNLLGRSCLKNRLGAQIYFSHQGW
jgi:hypothetical protein